MFVDVDLMIFVGDWMFFVIIYDCVIMYDDELVE